jgi:hypothetical protein
VYGSLKRSPLYLSIDKRIPPPRKPQALEKINPLKEIRNFLEKSKFPIDRSTPVFIKAMD